ncbi:MAG: hypothetical protein KC609_15075 [Myxococcales bacterium]|nr:hypothetical protein [Myxococcales bacterium]
MLYRALYFLREALKNVRYSKFPTLAAIGTIAISLVLLWVFALLLRHGAKLEQHVNQSMAMFVYLRSATSDAEIKRLATTVRSWQDVRRVRVVGLAEARKESRRLLSPQEAQGLKLSDIPALPYLEVHLTGKQRTRDDYDRIRDAVEAIKKEKAVHSVAYGEREVRLIQAALDVARFLGWTIAIIIAIASVYFTFSTIRLAVYARQEEIEILKLIGATNLFIRLPFYLEGFLQGRAGGLGALLLLKIVENRFLSYLSDVHRLSEGVALTGLGESLYVVGGGILLGMLGSFLSTRRFLRV